MKKGKTTETAFRVWQNDIHIYSLLC